MLQHVFGMTSDRIGLCLDTAWAIDSRLDPVKMVTQFGLSPSAMRGIPAKESGAVDGLTAFAKSKSG